ncbi:MAG TPA: response regulator [Candidatus Omnitrophota bacterium]|nr:response regulator [Candidatus Omnitrophota bacterium]HQO58497.1 response regulator [Candidatus Omnitrophota bacterium]HQP11685.1 response regulator [Candidatus Omnitrophota bacterium]
MFDVKATVLIVDDDEVTRRLLEKILINNSYKVETAAHGLEGIKKYWRSRPDLIVLDIQMPVMDGFEFIAEFKKIGDLKRTPIIILTSFETKQAAMAVEGIDDYFTKPFKMSELVSRIDELILKKNAENSP